jgi:hypothetical protein
VGDSQPATVGSGQPPRVYGIQGPRGGGSQPATVGDNNEPTGETGGK